MVKYNLEHLTQNDSQNVLGPIQDDEALFLYSIIRGNRLSRILEIGGLAGYSAKNFLQALSLGKNGILYTCDLNPVPVLAENHKVIIKNALTQLRPEHREAVEFIYFNQLTQEEAAKALSLTQSAFSKRLNKALSKLKNILENNLI